MHRARSDLICHFMQDDFRVVTISHCQQHALIAAIDARLFIAATFLLKTAFLFITAAILNLGTVVYSSYGEGMNWMESDIFNGFFCYFKGMYKALHSQSKT